LKKNEERMPWAALLQMRKIVALECPCRISKLPGPANKQDVVHHIPYKLERIPCVPLKVMEILDLPLKKLISLPCPSF
jgi:hypothetical protein